MNILKFTENRAKIENQYSRFYETADKERAKKLYDQIKEIYYGEKSKAVGFGKAIKHYFEKVELNINPADIFSDMANTAYSPCFLIDEEYRKYKINNSDKIFPSEGAFGAVADFGHTMPDWNRVLDLGIVGILENAEECLKKTNLSKDEKNFYESVKYAYEGILVYIERLCEECKKMNSVNSQFSAQNLYSLLKGKPQNMAEAMQLYFIYYSAQLLTQGNTLRSLGAVDDILYPYYKRDLEKGIYNEEDIRELIRYFLFKWNSRQILANIPFNLCTHINELTYLILEEYEKLNIPDPKIHIKCSENMTDRAYKMIMMSIRNGNNSFVFVNGDIVKKALVKLGIEKCDAEDYTVIGCYEPCAAGKEIPCTLNGRINMPMAVETVLNNGKRFSSDKSIGVDFGDEFGTFDEFYNAVKTQLKSWSEIAISEINDVEKQYSNIIHSPILSATYESCMENGKDAYSGGAKYNNSSICIYGLGTVIDELVAIKKGVFEDKIVTLSELKTILKENWSNAENLRKIMADRYPKYGNNDNEADSLACDLTEYMSKCINQKPNGRCGVYRMGMFSIDWIIEAGKNLGASADGRFAGEPVSKNLSASVGMDKKGITGAINSAAKLDFTNTPNGAVLDLNLHPTAVSGEEGIEIMISVLKTYLNKGGFAVHFNVVDPKVLKEAQKDPQKYKNLQVRLCGWNVYFTDLDKEMQDNFIKSLEV